MQKLIYEQAWDKTLSKIDRQEIEEVFHETKDGEEMFVTIWDATNHRGALLVTALIHNRGDEAVTFVEEKIRYVSNESVVAEHPFTIPALSVEPKTSMPWTFIFPAGSWDEEFSSDQLEELRIL